MVLSCQVWSERATKEKKKVDEEMGEGCWSGRCRVFGGKRVVGEGEESEICPYDFWDQ